MKTLVLLAASLLAGAASAQTISATEKQALAKQLNELMRDPKKPKQEVKLELSGCHVQQTIRDKGADVRMSEPVAVSVNKGGSDWSVNLDDGKFEMKMGFDWREVTAITYALNTNNDRRTYDLKVKRHSKNSDTTTSMSLYTSNETLVKDLVRRLEAVRQSCR
jgi:opacity protein-like surface antigen